MKQTSLVKQIQPGSPHWQGQWWSMHPIHVTPPVVEDEDTGKGTIDCRSTNGGQEWVIHQITRIIIANMPQYLTKTRARSHNLHLLAIFL